MEADGKDWGLLLDVNSVARREVAPFCFEAPFEWERSEKLGEGSEGIISFSFLASNGKNRALINYLRLLSASSAQQILGLEQDWAPPSAVFPRMFDLSLPQLKSYQLQ